MSDVKISPRKYPSTSQFRQVISNVASRVRYAGKDEQGHAVFDPTRELPTVKYRGTVKVHGTNGSLIKFADGRIYRQSKERILDITHDNYGFFEFMYTVPVEQLFDKVQEIFTASTGLEVKYPIEIAGEWAGNGIQSGVAVGEVPRFFMIFGVNVGVDAQEEGYGWQDLEQYQEIEMPEKRIFNALRFGKYEMDIDFQCPERSQAKLAQITMDVEEKCPVGAALGATENAIGEGVVWVPVGANAAHTGMWFKVKGDKHSVSKVKTLAAISPEKLDSIDKFVEYACTQNRMDQGIQEVGLDIRKTGEYIGWMNRDIFKEEADVLAASGLTMKDVGKYIGDKARKYFMSKVA